jgi:hypothetical protein
MKKVTFLLLFPFIAQVVISCCNCMETTTYYYSNKALSVSNLDGSGHQAVISQSDTILKKAYGIRVDLVREQVACSPKWQSPFVNSAYAFSCGCPPAQEYLARDSITTIRIFTNFAFDSNHPTGSDISVYFKILQAYTFYTIVDYIRLTPVILHDQRELSVTRDFLLMVPPTLGSDHSFKIQYTLSDGRVLERETLPVKLI